MRHPGRKGRRLSSRAKRRVSRRVSCCAAQAFSTLSQLSHIAPISAAELKAFEEDAAKRCLAHDGQMCRELLRRVANHECNESDYVMSKADVDSANRMAGVEINSTGCVAPRRPQPRRILNARTPCYLSLSRSTRSLSEMHPKEIKRWYKRNPGKKFRQPAPVYAAAVDVA